MASNLKIVQESETQRQHVRVEVPARARIGSELYKVKDMSVGGISVYADEEISRHTTGNIKILFPFTAYAFQLEVKAQLVDFNREDKIASLKFVELNSSQASLLNYIIKAYMTGSLVTEGDLINVAMRDNTAKPRLRLDEQERNPRAAFKRILPTMLVSMVGVIGLLFFLGNLYENSSILKSYQGVVESDKVNIRSFADGTVTLLIPEDAEQVAKGQPLAVIDRTYDFRSLQPGLPANKELTVVSPCDCFIQARLVDNGEFRAFGEPLFNLIPVATRPWIIAQINPEQAHHLRLQGDANIRVAGEGGFVLGHIMDISADKPFTKVKIQPAIPMPYDMLGRPAYIEFAGN